MWEKKDILIFVKTYPEYSSKHTETVCTGGVFADSGRLVRLYPIAYRYLEGEKQFQKYQWIKANVQKSTTDSRPESYKIDNYSINLGKVISSKNWQERKKWILNNNHIYDSVESLLDENYKSEVSMGLIKPKEIVDCRITRRSESELRDAQSKKKSIMNQTDMFREKSDLEILDFKFYLKFLCNSPQCNGHEFSILDWEIGALYRRVRNTIHWKDKIINKITTEIFAKNRDTYLILGNMARRRKTFCILGFFWPPKEDEQLPLFR